LDLTHYRRITTDELKEIEAEANRIVKKGGKVNIKFMDRDKAEKKYGFKLYQGGAVPGKIIRVVDMLGYDAEACGGTHVRDLKDIKLFKIIRRKNVQDGRERIEYVCGKAAEALKAKPVEDLEKIKKEKKKAFQAVKAKAKEELESVIKLAKDVNGVRVINKYFETLNVKDLVQISRRLAKEKDLVAILGCSDPTPTIIIGSTSKAYNAKELLDNIKGIKGGGNSAFARGVLTAGNIEKVIQETDRQQLPSVFFLIYPYS